MDKEQLNKLKESRDILYIYKIPCSFFDEQCQYVIIGNIPTRIQGNEYRFNIQDWFQRVMSGSILPVVVSRLHHKYKIKNYAQITWTYDILSLRKFLLNTTNRLTLVQESLWGYQFLTEGRINRPDVFKGIDKYIPAEECLQKFLEAIQPRYKFKIDNNGKD
ncbi:MAG: hypothetical protein KBT03_10375 [Bacteroidales bacterium]|nr:hypothetical protein [Candidatus Scybalousia scybalohippi]